MNEIHSVISSVWNEGEDEKYRQDQSHYRGVGRWADDEAWKAIGKSSLDKMRALWRLLNRNPSYISGLTVLEWGPGGGANVYGLSSVASKYYGVDIAEKNLAECTRLMSSEGRSDYFRPILLNSEPAAVIPFIDEPVQAFISTAVFQHFPNRPYGGDVLRAIRAVCSEDAAGFIQIRFDNGNPKYRGIDSLADYKTSHIYANSYPLDHFWDICVGAGFEPLAVTNISTKNNYATYLLKAK